MKMLALLMLGVLSFSSFAGERGGNGGVGLVCMTQGQIEKVVMYDFAEGKAFHKDEIVQSEGASIEDYLAAAIKRMSDYHPYLGVMLKTEIDEIRSDKVWMVGSFAVDQTPDTQNYGYVVRVCNDPNQDPEFHQVANYLDKINQLRIDEKYLNGMDNLNQAGLIVHEAIYRIDRRVFKLQNSDRARRVNSLLFSKEKVGSNEELALSDYLKDYFNGIFVRDITYYRANFIDDWKKSPNYESALELIKTRNLVTLSYGIKLDLGFNVENLPLYAEERMEIERHVQDLKRRFNFEEHSIWNGLGAVLAGVPAGMPLAWALGPTASPLILIPGAAAVAGFLVVDGVIDEIRFKKLVSALKLIQGSEQCLSDQNKCNQKSLIRPYKKFSRKVKNVSIKAYAERVVKLARKGTFFTKKKRRPFATVKEMNKIIIKSFQ